MLQIESTLTCPRCGHQSTEQMPTDACRFFYACKGCGETLARCHARRCRRASVAHEGLVVFQGRGPNPF